MNSLRPGDFPIGSALSRAAARLLMKERRDTRKRVTLISNVCRPGGDENEPHVGTWRDFGDTLMRMIYLLNVWLKPGQAIPSCPGCGTSFKKENEYASMVSYTANCLDLHVPEIVGKQETENLPP